MLRPYCLDRSPSLQSSKNIISIRQSSESTLSGSQFGLGLGLVPTPILPLGEIIVEYLQSRVSLACFAFPSSSRLRVQKTPRAITRFSSSARLISRGTHRNVVPVQKKFFHQFLPQSTALEIVPASGTSLDPRSSLHLVQEWPDTSEA